MFDKVSPRSALPSVCMSVSASIPVESSGRLIIEHVPGREMEGKRQPFQSASLLLSYTLSLPLSLFLSAMPATQLHFKIFMLTFYILAIRLTLQSSLQ